MDRTPPGRPYQAGFVRMEGTGRVVESETTSFGSLLRRFRTASGLTQEELAERAQLSARAISDLERGVNASPRLYTLRQLVDGLELSPEDRSVFERSARDMALGTREGLTPIEGSFLGALPVGVLVNREKEMARIRSALDAPADGAVQLLLLEGERGVGKTRLLQEVMVTARAKEHAILAATCYASERSTPYHPFLEALSSLPTSLVGPGRAEGHRAWRRLEELTSHDQTGSSPRGGAAAQRQVLSTIADVLVSAIQSRPLTLLLDDLEWADGDSLKVLHHLARATRGQPILLVGSFCDVDVAEEHRELAEVLQMLSRERLAERIMMRRLSLDETTALVEAQMGQATASEEFASFVYRRTKGNPHLIDQMVRSLGGRLELRGEVGSGSTGRVFRAFDRQTGRAVAAKLILAREGIDLGDLLRFQQEAAVLAALDHPNIVGVYDTFAEEHAACIVMELLDGQSLGLLLQQGPLPLSRAKAIALQAAAALSYAHSQSIVHCDIKPDNVMVAADDQVKITDFGIARIVRRDNSLATMATTGMRAGTPAYMAPEQIAGKQTDGRADLYALGAMLFHMVTGRPPFEGPDKLSVAVKHLQDQPVAPSSINREVPADWDALILKALQKEPSRRFQTAKEMETAIAGLGVRPGAATPKRARRRAVLAAAGGVLGVLVLAAVILANVATPSHAKGLGARINTYLSGLTVDKRFSGTVLVARNGRVVLDSGYGLANRQTNARAGAATEYPVAGFTAILSMTDILRKLDGAGPTFGWSHPICEYLPTCPRFWRPITVRMLLDGTANIPHTDNMGQAGHTPEQSVASCQSVPLDAKVRWRIDYENCGDLVMGILAQRVAGSGNWEAQFEGKGGIFDVAGMNSTRRGTDAVAVSPAVAQSYDGPTAYTQQVYNDDFVAYSTVGDINAFDSALFGGRLVSRADAAMIFTPRGSFSGTGCCAFPNLGIAHPQWGYEWKTGILFGRRVFYTFRGENGFQAVNMHFPSSGLTVVVLSNDQSNDGLGIAMNAAALAYGRQLFHPPPIQTSIPTALLGTYRRTITVRDIRVVSQDPNQSNLIGGPMTMRIKKGWVDFGIPGVPSGAGDEYIGATPQGGLTLLGYTPTNGGGCSDIATEQPPYAHYHWRRQGSFLVITRTAPDFCADRRIVEGRWRRIG
jgi:transcriptional regulator with XRE-family HTH domain/CubicO group peptidase (beta-lactamase class C family)